jgi:cytochrome c-type biogenesis protein CcmE
MVQTTWEKPKVGDSQPNTRNRIQFILAGVILLGAVAYLIFSGTVTGGQYFLTVDEVVNNPEHIGQTVRVSGAVLGDTIDYDSQTLNLDFTIVNIPSEFENLAETLHIAVSDPNAVRLPVHMENEVIPDLLQHEAQAIITGHIGEDGVFYATELLLKCPSRYEEAVPGQSIVESNQP